MIALKPIPGSTQVSAAAYDPATRVLSVVFHGKPTRYDYQDVPPEVAEAFDKAESKGRFIGTYVKGKYEFTKTDTAAA